LGEISYQTVLDGFNVSLEKDRRTCFILYNTYTGHYGLTSSKDSRQEVNAMLEYRFPQGKFKRHDPKGLVLKHKQLLNIAWPYAHEIWEREEIYDNVVS
jgi:hypothetical protein